VLQCPARRKIEHKRSQWIELMFKRATFEFFKMRRDHGRVCRSPPVWSSTTFGFGFRIATWEGHIVPRSPGSRSRHLLSLLRSLSCGGGSPPSIMAIEIHNHLAGLLSLHCAGLASPARSSPLPLRDAKTLAARSATASLSGFGNVRRHQYPLRDLPLPRRQRLRC
jgi:hypothetical protein